MQARLHGAKHPHKAATSYILMNMVQWSLWTSKHTLAFPRETTLMLRQVNFRYYPGRKRSHEVVRNGVDNLSCGLSSADGSLLVESVVEHSRWLRDGSAQSTVVDCYHVRTVAKIKRAGNINSRTRRILQLDTSFGCIG